MSCGCWNIKRDRVVFEDLPLSPETSLPFSPENAPEPTSLPDVTSPACPICMKENVPTVLLTTTSCGHTFCTGCLASWCSRQMNCPMCRSTIAPVGCSCSDLSNSDLRKIVLGIDDNLRNIGYTPIMIDGEEVLFSIRRGKVRLLYESDESKYTATFYVKQKQHYVHIDASESAMFMMRLKARVDDEVDLVVEYVDH